MDYRKCFITTYKSDSVNSPGKIFVKVREDLRKKWCQDAGVKYASKVIMYCCEDHIDPVVDLKNYHKTKLMNHKTKAVLKNVTQKPEIPMVTSEETELEKLLLLPHQDPIPSKKRKFEDNVMPSISSTILFPLKVQVGVQCKPIMVDKSTNFKTRKSIASTTKVFEVQSSQESSSATPSLFGCTSETEESTSEKCKLQIRNKILEIIYKKPKMYLGLPKQYLWLIDYLVVNSVPKIDSLCIIATLLKIKQNDTIERISDQ